MSWAIRVTLANGHDAFLRRGSGIGHGPIMTFHSKAKAEEEAAFVREGFSDEDVVIVIERSHGRRTADE